MLATSATALAFGGLGGCLSEPPATATGSSSPDPTGSPETKSSTDAAGGAIAVRSLSVADFVLYPLSGTHPHVHRRSGVQYVVVRVTTSLQAEAVSERLRLELDAEPMPLASRQPVPWAAETTDVAFAVPKDETYDDGQVLFDESARRTLSGAVIERLNAPPVFEVGDVTVSPNEIEVDERTTATVRFELRNAGEGAGTFGASLKGNFVSGAATVTTTLASGAAEDVSASTSVVGEGEAAVVRLDWGSGEWTGEIPVVGTPTGTGTATPTPAPR